MSITLIKKDYSWEELGDISNDAFDAIEYDNAMPEGEFTGTVRMTIEYIHHD